MANTKELIQESKPDLIAHLKVTRNAVETHEQVAKQTETGVVNTTTVYSKIIAPNKDHMDKAIMYYATKYGALAIETVTIDEYNDATST